MTSKVHVRASSGSSKLNHSWRSRGPAVTLGAAPGRARVSGPWAADRRALRFGLVAGELDDIKGRLEGISEELADLAIVRLRDCIVTGGGELPVDEKLLSRARRAVEKAVHILNEVDEDDD